MRVFLTGATGYIGSAVADALVAAGYEVVGLARPGRDPNLLEQRGIRPFAGTLANPKDIVDEAERADAVIHTAFEWSPNGPLIDEAFIGTLLDALSGTSKRLVYTSGVWVMGNTSADAGEDSPLDPPPVVAWRVAVEQKIRDAARTGLRTVVLRPAMVYGRSGGLVLQFFRSARETGVALYVGSGENHWTFVHIDDLADLYLRALEAEPGSLFIGASGPPVRVREVAEAASHAVGGSGHAQEWERDEALAVLGPAVQGLVLDQRVSGKRAEKVLGWRPRARSILDEIRHGSYAAGA